MKGILFPPEQIDGQMLRLILQHSFSLEASALGYGHWYVLSELDQGQN
jgi:hypothetical protein